MGEEYFGSSSLNQVHDAVIGTLSNKGDYLVAARDIHRYLPDKGSGILGTPPVEVIAAFTPITTLPLAQNVGLVVIVIDMEIETNRHLPADFRLPINEVFAP